ncbi:hypothetical protein [Paenibacillus sp. 7523-1]|uniref:hypothetical protein n=1 Tax=Paenibacillus sp. 7523-1 TaxID=2022550 RepID=UPI000BA5D561|nr:hypothetical protein [Paenibacillus sp. 7523-1]PAD30394.1 hypothetical protein CHH60_16550 [Paenibacillus sp. 7523-1]
MKKIIPLVLSLTVASGLVGATGASATTVTPTPTASTDIGIMAEIDQPVSGGYAYSHYLASGGRVNIEVHELYLNAADARVYATKSETSIGEGAFWFGASFIPVAGPYLSSLGFLKTVSDSVFVSSIRKYADKGQGVHVVIAKDNFYNTTTRSAGYWNGLRDTVKSSSSLNADYLVSSYAQIKY